MKNKKLFKLSFSIILVILMTISNVFAVNKTIEMGSAGNSGKYIANTHYSKLYLKSGKQVYCLEAGKTPTENVTATLVNNSSRLSGIIPKSSGIIDIKDNYSIAYMLQDDSLLPFRTVLENCLIGLEITKKNTEENKQYVIELLNTYGLGDFINKYPNSLSGGMRQNVAVKAITSKVEKAIIDKKIKNVIVAGGVAANSGLRKAMEELCSKLNVELSIPPMKYCTDNGTMIAAAGYYAYKEGRRADLYLNSKSQDTLK